ncbi:AMP-binding protein [candidate division GN15 bacterium]|nr:AMP-binding protein [candidate division GN15 bacterium]
MRPLFGVGSVPLRDRADYRCRRGNADLSFFAELEHFSANTAAIDAHGTPYRYGELVDAADTFGRALQTDRKSLVFILCRNNIETLAGYLGTLRAGHTGVLLAANTDRGLMANLLELYRPDFIWGPSDRGGDARFTWKGYALSAGPSPREEAIHPELALLLSTSGSTGSPKMVRLTAANLEANAQSIAEYLALDETERPITSLPMNYSYGLSVVNSHLKVGATLLLTDASIITRPFWTAFNDLKATSFAGVPYTYEMLRRIKFFTMDLPGLRTMTQAGGKLTPEFAREFAEYAAANQLRFFIMYGQTEATARISYVPPEQAVEKHRSIGVAIPRGELRLIDGDGNPITQPGVDGELVYTGPNVMLGYAQSSADLVKGNELNGELHTGDIARFDDDGFYYVTGRKKRFIKIFGNRVNLDEIEHYLKGRGYVSVCGGRDDLLCVATTEPGKVDEIKKLVTATYGFHHTAVRVAEVAEILKSASGKIQYERIFEGMLD